MIRHQKTFFCPRLTLGLLLACGVGTAAGGAFPEGAATQLCAVYEVQICEPDAACRQRPERGDETIRFIKFSLTERLAISTLESGERRRSTIDRVSREGDAIVLSGSEPGRGWGAVLEPAAARLTLTHAEPGLGYVFFGRCTPEP